MSSITRKAWGTWLAALLLTSPCAWAAQPGVTAVTAGKARFEFLTGSLVRMEYSPSGVFVDAPTAVVQKRKWPAVKVTTTRQHGWFVATTDSITLRYLPGSGAFTAGNLRVRWKGDSASDQHAWHPGQIDRGNLGGLTYSLDNISKPDLPADGKDLASPVNDLIPGINVLLAKAKPGLLSRSGYAFIDDSRTPVWNAKSTWIEPRTQQGNQDWYLFVYARDYRKVLQEYAELCGPIPMIPRYTLGPWITDFNFEYFPGTAQTRQPAFQRYNEQHLKDEVSRFRDSHIPFDTLVLDFGWHNYGWQGGYDWSPLIPHPRQLLRWLHARGVKLSLNDHPGYANARESILSHQDSHAPAVLKAMGQPMPLKATFDLDLSGGWKFSTDPRDQGLDQRWFDAAATGPAWKPVAIGSSWQAQGYATYQGVGWYGTSVRLPAQLPPRLYLYLGEVGASYRIFVNGRQVRHSQVHWPRELTYTDLSPYLRAGQANRIVLRVVADERDGGILRGPVVIRDVPPPPRIYFDLSDQRQAYISMHYLHQPLMREGVDAWWVDGGSGAVDMPGLNKQLWTNKVFYDFTRQETGKRAFILSRYGDWGSERYPAYFTGDTYSQWPVLAYEVAFTVRGGNVLVPYISHDIGGFHGNRIAFDLYARWVEFGTFSPILRLHSAHENPRDGNARMPWNYGAQGMNLLRKYFTLRTQLIPYIYTYTWIAHTQSMPILRPLYLVYPGLAEAYRHPHEYFFGKEMLVAPVLEASGDREVYLPPGQWIDFFSAKRYVGGRSFNAHYATDDIPVFVRDGAIIPEQSADLAWSNQKPLDKLILNVYGTGQGRFELYQDDGNSFAYRNGQHASTLLTYFTTGEGVHRLVVGATTGEFSGQLKRRAYEVRIHTTHKPQSVTADGRELHDWQWNDARATATVAVPAQDIRHAVRVTWSSVAQGANLQKGVVEAGK